MSTTSSAVAIAKSKGRARATNDPTYVPLASSHRVQARRRRDLVSIYLTALGESVTDLQLVQVRKAAELTAAAESLRARVLAGEVGRPPLLRWSSRSRAKPAALFGRSTSRPSRRAASRSGSFRSRPTGESARERLLEFVRGFADGVQVVDVPVIHPCGGLFARDRTLIGRENGPRYGSIAPQVYYRDGGTCGTTGLSRATLIMWFRNSIGCAILFSGSKPAPVPRTVTVP